MLQNGYPFEVMDGDTGMVPVPWVHAVLRQLKEDIGDKTMYAISVLGIQSSGKSTLLNTMFGLDFAVSSGRCTRGVFMQLIKVTDPSLRCDYLLILDTEGIRASIYEKDRRSFENELATFAIGLGNITLLNIKGENTSEIEDFLQIAVHACLRLKMANKNIKMHQTCVFVHQNVCAHDAFVKLRDLRETLRYRLNKMVTDAARHEDRSDLYSFNQLIGFDIEKDVWYFPDLWQGEPPMATVTVGYSDKVSSLRKYILHNVAQSNRTRYSVTQTMVRIEDIWRGILMDDFVLSFRNGLEIQAYREMESFFQRLTWHPECEVDKFISTIVGEKIARCTNDDELESVCSKYSHQLGEKLADIFLISKDEWKDFVSKNSFKHLIEQYMDSRTLQLEEMEELLLQKGQTDIYRRTGCHKAFLLQKTKRETHMIELKNKANDLVTKCKTDELADSDLENHFDDMWNTWINGIKSVKEEHIMSIEKVVEKKMTDMFKSINPYLNTVIETTRNNRDNYRKMTRLVGSIDLIDIQNEHVTPVSSKDIFQKAYIMKCKQGALSTINILLKKIDTYISSLKTEYLLYNESHVKQVFMHLIESLNTNNSQINNYFLMTASLRAKLVVHVKMYISEVFTTLNDEYKEKNDMKKQMQSDKKTFFKYFLSLVKDKAVEVRMANLFLSKIEPFIVDTVKEKLPTDVVKMIIPDTFSTKYSLMIEIMTYLVRKSDFNEFRQYIDNSSVYALDWLTSYMNTNLFHAITEGKNEYTIAAETHIDRICAEILKSVSYATDQVIDNTNKNNDSKTNISAWSTDFEEHLSQSLKITEGTFRNDNDDEIKNFCNYKTLIVDGIKILMQEIKFLFQSQNEQNVRWTESPYKRVFNKLWGCHEQCPFCKESCQKSADHLTEKHSCIQHRPPAVWGVRKVQSQVMTWMPCNCLVYSDDTFRCGASNFKCRKSGTCEGSDDSETYHPYREYNTLIPNWLIEPSPLNEPPEYWIWFISKYKNELCEAYNYKVYKDMQEWETITESEALLSLTRVSRSSEV